MRGKTILIIEDEALIAVSVESLVENSGGTPVSVSGFAQASALRHRWPDIALAIVNPPRHPGEATIAREMAEAGIALLVSSADTGYDPAAHGLVGVSVLRKPFTEAAVEDMISQVLAGSRS